MTVTTFASRAAAGVLVISAAIAACGDRELVLGSGPERSPVGTIGPDAGGNVWSGYVQGFSLASGSDRMTVTFTSETTGTVFFGDTPPADPPPVDPNVPYPPGCARTDPIRFPEPLRCSAGFAFQLLDAKRESNRLRFAIDVGALLKDWCPTQTLITVESWWGDGRIASYGCAGVHPVEGTDCSVSRLPPDGGSLFVVPPDGGMPIPPMADTPVDCALRDACRQCTCTADGCTAARSLVNFDLHVNGDHEADGDSTIGTVHLQEQ